MPYSVEVTLFTTGERFAHLIDLTTGRPHFDSTIFNMVKLRGRALATSTIEQELRAIKVFLIFCEMQKISLQARFQTGVMFQTGELDGLLRLCRRPLEDIEAMAQASKESAAGASIKRLQLLPRTKAEAEVGNEWIGNRIRYIRDYIDWLVESHLGRLTPKHENYLPLSEQRSSTFKKLTESAPADKGRNVVNQRVGLDEKQQAVLLEVITTGDPKNVWVGHHCQVRNELMVLMFIKLGIRRGELGGISVRDINFQAKTLLIRRRADDKHDKRVNQPNTKTRDRILPLGDDLLQRVHRYVVGERRAQKLSGTHPFLFVANGGRAMGLRAINKVFEALVNRCGEFEELFPHLLRHTFNDNLSSNMDKNEVSEAEEERTRSLLNGWSPTSGSAATYTKRTIQRRANKASLELQEKQPVQPLNDE